MSAGGPQTTKEAAVRLLLGELGPLFDKAETLAATLNEAHDLIETDLAKIGAMVTRTEETISNTMDHVTHLLDQVKELRQSPAAAPAQKHAAPSPAGKAPIVAMLLCSLFSAALAVGGVVVFNLSTIEDARIGRAVSNAVQYLDVGTKQKLESAMQKAASQ